MMFAHTVIHFPVPSVSGHAVLTLPLLVPLSDLIGLSRQVTVLAYQYGAGLCEAVHPHQRRADGDARRGGSPLRRMAAFRPATLDLLGRSGAVAIAHPEAWLSGCGNLALLLR